MIPPGFVTLRKTYAILVERDKSEAAGRLAFLLCHGQLQAFHFDGPSGEEAISAKWWLTLSDDLRKEVFIKGALQEIVIREEDLAKLVPPKDNAGTLSSGEAGSTKKGGRLPKYDWDDIWAGIVRIVHDEGLPKSQEEMIEKVQLWYGQHISKDNAPSRAILQPKIARLFARMR